MRIVALLLITYAALLTGYLQGHNNGFDLGRIIGKLDAKFTFRHNGVIE